MKFVTITRFVIYIFLINLTFWVNCNRFYLYYLMAPTKSIMNSTFTKEGVSVSSSIRTRSKTASEKIHAKDLREKVEKSKIKLDVPVKIEKGDEHNRMGATIKDLRMKCEKYEIQLEKRDEQSDQLKNELLQVKTELFQVKTEFLQVNKENDKLKNKFSAAIKANCEQQALIRRLIEPLHSYQPSKPDEFYNLPK